MSFGAQDKEVDLSEDFELLGNVELGDNATQLSISLVQGVHEKLFEHILVA
jgi:hypothetical protein